MRGRKIQRALVDRATGDGALYAFALHRAQRLDVVEIGDTAAGNHRHRQRARELYRGFDVHAAQHAVTADVGVDHGFGAVVFEFFGQINDIMPGHFRPAIHRDFAVFGVEPHHHVPGKRGARVVQKARRFYRSRADDDVADARIEIVLNGIQITDAAAQLDRQFVAHRRHNRLDRRAVFRPPRGCTVEIDHVQTARTQIEPALRGGAGVV